MPLSDCLWTLRRRIGKWGGWNGCLWAGSSESWELRATSIAPRTAVVRSLDWNSDRHYCSDKDKDSPVPVSVGGDRAPGVSKVPAHFSGPVIFVIRRSASTP